MNIDLTHLNHQTFERLCNDLLDIEIEDVKLIEGSGGDKGVDGFRGEISGGVEIYQHKFFTHALKSSQKSQIKDSFLHGSRDAPRAGGRRTPRAGCLPVFRRRDRPLRREGGRHSLAGSLLCRPTERPHPPDGSGRRPHRVCGY